MRCGLIPPRGVPRSGGAGSHGLFPSARFLARGSSVRCVRTGAAAGEGTSGSHWTPVVVADAVMQEGTNSQVTHSRETGLPATA